MIYAVEKLLQKYLEVEKLFFRDGRFQEDSLLSLRAAHKDNLLKVAEIALAQSQVRANFALEFSLYTRKPIPVFLILIYSQTRMRSKLVFMLLETLSDRRLVSTENTSLCETLKELASLGNTQNAKVRTIPQNGSSY